MLREKQNIADYVERAVLVILFLLVLSAFTEKSVNKNDDIAKQETLSCSQSSDLNAIIVNSAQLPSFQKEWVINTDYSFVKLSDENMKSKLDNKKSLHTIIYLKYVNQIVKPLLIKRFYNQHHISTSDEIPVLS
jgi:hypothetical protein